MSLPLIAFIQRRWSTVDFFMRNNQKTLWKGATAVSKAGAKKGNKKLRQIPRDLNQLYEIGKGPIKVIYPGLNERVTLDSDTIPDAVQVTPPDTDYEKSLGERIDSKSSRRRVRPLNEKLHPLERGFVGTSILGQRLGPPPPVDGMEFANFESYCLAFGRFTNMKSVGRVPITRALVVTGNGKGSAGFAIGRAPPETGLKAVARGLVSASRKLVYIDLLEGRTIYHDFFAECNCTRLFVQRRSAGYGLSCHPRLIKVCQLIGIKDIHVKVEGSTNNYYALIKAFFTGLNHQETHQQLAERRGLHVVELSPTSYYLPRIVASPINSELRGNDDLTPIERLELDDFYGEGRYPYNTWRREPMWKFSQQHRDYVFRRHPYRNHHDVQIRLMADGHVKRWTRTERHAWAARRHQQVAVQGLQPIPNGIGLSILRPRINDD